jgi:hypothetical protein
MWRNIDEERGVVNNTEEFRWRKGEVNNVKEYRQMKKGEGKQCEEYR